jgi:lysophospholipase L1-like esterase
MKKVLLIGDSIRLGYCRYVKEELKDIADVYYPDENCRYTQYTFVELSKWLAMAGDPKTISAVHWNNGHWDIAHWQKDRLPLNSAEQYSLMLERIYQRLRSNCPSAKITFALTTTVHPDGLTGENPRTNEEIKLYNDAARKVISGLGGQINDLFSVTKDFPPSLYSDWTHFTEEGYRLLAKTVAKVIRDNLRSAPEL